MIDFGTIWKREVLLRKLKHVGYLLGWDAMIGDDEETDACCCIDELLRHFFLTAFKVFERDSWEDATACHFLDRLDDDVDE